MPVALADKLRARGAVLPDYAAVILDEAHQIEDVASEYFGSQVSNYQIDDLLNDLGGLKIEDNETNWELTRISARVQRYADMFWISFREGRGLEGRFSLAPRGISPTVREGSDAGMDAGEPQAEMPALPHHALDNALNDRAIQRDFARDPVSWAAKLYLSQETMSIR